jgi:hypothetical protein
MLLLGQADDQPGARLAYGWIGPSLSFVLGANHLPADSDWTLAVLPGNGSAVCLASARSNAGGALQAADTVELDSHLPAGLDPFAPHADDTRDASVALLPAAAVDCDGGVIIDADAALIAADGLRFVDTDLIECP